MKKVSLALLYAACAAAAVISAPATADPPPWAPAHGRRAKEMREEHHRAEYRYVYYPAQQVYYAPDQQVWFWMSGGAWQFGASLPGQLRVAAGAGVPVMLQSERPYVEHVYVEQHYGRPWREKHRH